LRRGRRGYVPLLGLPGLREHRDRRRKPDGSDQGLHPGDDRIDLSLIDDANPTIEGDQALTFLTNPEQHIGDWTGTVWITTDERGPSTMINISSHGDAGAEMQIYLPTAIALTANDFIL
jgi:hypothetical protein